MNQIRANKNPYLGFLTVFEVPSAGFGGGLLVTSSNGRPVEFHCTAPVDANRAQQILYGQTLRSFLFCDQIGIALIEKVSTALDVIVTDTAEMTEMHTTVKIPFALVDLEPTENADDPLVEFDSRISRLVSENADQTLQVLKQFIETLPLNEPFERIQQAIAEAHKVAA